MIRTATVSDRDRSLLQEVDGQLAGHAAETAEI